MAGALTPRTVRALTYKSLPSPLCTQMMVYNVTSIRPSPDQLSEVALKGKCAAPLETAVATLTLTLLLPPHGHPQTYRIPGPGHHGMRKRSPFCGDDCELYCFPMPHAYHCTPSHSKPE